MDPSIKLVGLTFSKDRFPTSQTDSFKLNDVTILVGPNNSGKSQILREIENILTKQSVENFLISDLNLDLPKNDIEIEQLVHKFQSDPPPNRGSIGEIYLATPSIKDENQIIDELIPIPDLQYNIKNQNMRGIIPRFSKFFVARLDGASRFRLIEPKVMGNWGKPKNILSLLYVDDSTIDELEKIVHQEFRYYPYLWIDNGNITILLTKEEIPNDIKRSTNAKAVDFVKKFTINIEQMGDGVKSFIGLLIAVSSIPHSIFLVDEPEAFLHPPQANHLGKQLIKIANKRNGSLLTATHSSDFLMGCLDSSPNITILRLTFDGKVGTVKQLNSEELSEIRLVPLLRSADTLNALFHKTAIITEADSDRVFYSEINRRLPSIEGIEDPIFLNAQNAQTIHRIIKPLRKIGVPAAGIFDLDIIRTGIDFPWNETLIACGFSQTDIPAINQERNFLESELKKFIAPNKPNPFKKCGITLLDKTKQQRAKKFLKQLSDKGLFIVPIGEMEEWLKELNIPSGEKSKWIVSMLDKLGKDNDPGKVKPKKGDVWDFIRSIAKWAQT